MRLLILLSLLVGCGSKLEVIDLGTTNIWSEKMVCSQVMGGHNSRPYTQCISEHLSCKSYSSIESECDIVIDSAELSEKL